MAALLPFLLLVWKVIGQGWAAFNPDLIMQPSPQRTTDVLLTSMGSHSLSKGILNGIYGTMLIISIAIVPAVLLGLLTGIYISDNRNGRFAWMVRQAIYLLHGTPAILIGLAVYWWMVRPANHFSALAGGLSLVIILLPTLTEATVRILGKLPNGLKESGYALGGSYFDVTCQVVIPAAGRRLAATFLLLITRALGKTSPFIVTAAGIDRMDWDMTEPVNTVTVLIWELFNNPAYVPLMWSALLFCLLIIFILHWITHLIYPPYGK
jgi:phosphate transport system permease protein